MRERERRREKLEKERGERGAEREGEEERIR